MASILALAFVSALPAATLPQEMHDRIQGSGGAFGAALAVLERFDSARGALIVGAPGENSVRVLGAGFSVRFTIFGSGSQSGFGSTVRVGGLLDGDLVPDILVGAPNWLSFGEGFVQAYSGLDGTAIGDPIRAPDTIFDSWKLGTGFAVVDDLNGDTFAEVVVGLPQVFDLSGRQRGELLVYSGDPSSRDLLWRSRWNDVSFGTTVDALGDVNGDGLPEILVGAPEQGRAYVFTLTLNSLTSGLQVLHGTPSPNRIAPGYAAPAGDVDGDGRPDVIYQLDARRARIHSVERNATIADVELPAGTPTSPYGELVVGSAGDFDGDGLDDVAIGVPLDSCSSTFGIPECDGGLYVFTTALPGGKLLAYLPGAEDTAGWAFAPLGDVDGDGHQDLAVGTPYFNQNSGHGSGAGAVTILSQKIVPPTPAVLEHEQTVLGPVRHIAFGRDVSGGRDMDADGLDDVAASAPHDDTVAQDAGRVQVLKGLTGEVLLDLFGEARCDYFGFSIAMDGDADGDGRADILVGAPGANHNGLNSGSVYVFRADGTLLYRRDGDAAASALGTSLAYVGDVNGDMRDDWIAGAPSGLFFGDCLLPGGLYNPFMPLTTHDTFGCYARLYSGADGSIIRTFAEVGAEEFGRYVDGGGFVDDDLVPDILVAAPRDLVLDDQGVAETIGSVFVYSGATGLPICAAPLACAFPLRGQATNYGSRSWDPFVQDNVQYGVNAMFAGDVNGDGRDDIAVAAHEQEQSDSSFETFGRLWILSGLDGSELYDSCDDRENGECDAEGRDPYAAFAAFGYSLIRTGDLDGDQRDDLLFSHPGLFNGGGDRSGGIQSLTHRASGEIAPTPVIEGFTDWDYYGYSGSFAGDVDGDGIGDVIIGIPTEPFNADNFQVGWNRVMILRGTNPTVRRPALQAGNYDRVRRR